MSHIKRKVDLQAFEEVAEVLSSFKSAEQMRLFLRELLTPGEVHDITLRWKLLKLLADRVTQRKIAEDLRISLCKITRGSKILKQNGMTASVLRKLAAARRKESDHSSGSPVGAGRMQS